MPSTRIKTYDFGATAAKWYHNKAFQRHNVTTTGLFDLDPGSSARQMIDAARLCCVIACVCVYVKACVCALAATFKGWSLKDWTFKG